MTSYTTYTSSTPPSILPSLPNYSENQYLERPQFVVIPRYSQNEEQYNQNSKYQPTANFNNEPNYQPDSERIHESNEPHKWFQYRWIIVVVIFVLILIIGGIIVLIIFVNRANSVPNMGSYTTTVTFPSSSSSVQPQPTASPSPSSIFNRNLIVNNGAENGLNSWTTVVGAPGFTQYITTTGDARLSHPPLEEMGIYHFFGSTWPLCIITQRTYLPFVVTTNIQANVSGWFGGWRNQNDLAWLKVDFYDTTNTIVASVAIGNVTMTDRNNVTGLWYRNNTISVPKNVNSVEFTLSMLRATGTNNNGYADVLNVILM